MLMIQPELEPHPSMLHAEIAELTDGYFDKMQRQLDVYRRDDRRLTEDGSLILASNESFLSGPDQTNGRLRISISHAPSRLETFQALVQTSMFKSIVTEHKKSQLGDAFANPQNWTWGKPGAANVEINVSREVFPEGNIMYPLMELDDEKEAIWGMRHQVGLDLGFMVVHKMLPLREEHLIKVGLKQRFDKSHPESFGYHRCKAIVGAGEETVGYVAHEELKKKSTAHRDVIELGEVLAQAKNLRLIVRGVKQEMALRERLAQQYKDFLAG